MFKETNGQKYPTSALKQDPRASEIPESVACSLDRLLQFRNRVSQYRFIREHLKAASSHFGGHKSAFRGRGMEFEEVRLYHSSDDIRHIDWRVTARTGQPHTKLFREERERPIFIVVDQSQSMFFGSVTLFKSVLAAHIAAAIAWDGFQSRDRVGGIIYNDDQLIELKPVNGKRGTLRYLHQLTALNQALVTATRTLNSHNLSSSVTHRPKGPANTLKQNSLLQALNHLRIIAKPGSIIHLITDCKSWHLEDEATRQQIEIQLALLRRHNDIHCLIIYDPLEKHIPNMGLLGFSDGVDRQQIDTRQSALRKRHADAFALHSQQLSTTLLDLGIPIHFFSTETSAEKQLSGRYFS